MSDQFHQHPPHWQPLDFVVGVSGMLSPWWLHFVHAFDAVVGGVAFYGGGLLVAVQLGRLAAGVLRKWGW